MAKFEYADYAVLIDEDARQAVMICGMTFSEENNCQSSRTNIVRVNLSDLLYIKAIVLPHINAIYQGE